jgi:hypothetical protein
MTIHRLLADTTFDPERVAALVAAYEEALKKLSLVDRDDPMTQMIARKTIEVAQRGVLDSKQISSIVIKELGF